MFTVRGVLSFLLAAVVLAACGGSGSPGDSSPAAQDVTVRVAPTSASVPPRGSASFAASVTGTSNTAVLWTVVEPVNAGSVTTGGVYTAPAAAGTFHVRATSAASSSAYADATVTVQPPTCSSFTYSAWTACVGGQQTRTVLTSSPAGCTGGTPVLAQSCVPVTVSVSPSPASVDACRTLTFTATVANATNGAVTWAVQEGSPGGTITSAGVYTAPSTAGTYHVVATSVADGTASATVAVTVGDHILSVAVNPPTASLTTGGTVQFTATVTTTCGTFAATGP
jgi:hypothetical protein